MYKFKELHIGLQSNSPKLKNKDEIVVINIFMRRLMRLKKYTDVSDLRMCIMDCSCMGFKDNSFEMVHSGKVIHWLNSEDKVKNAITEMLRVTSKKVIFTVPNFGADIYLREKYGLCFAHSTWKSHPEAVQHLFTEESLPKMLNSLGINNYKMNLVDEIPDSSDRHIIRATREYTIEFDESTMDKPFIVFDKPLYQIISVEIIK